MWSEVKGCQRYKDDFYSNYLNKKDYKYAMMHSYKINWITCIEC